MPVEKVLLPIDITHPQPAFLEQLNQLMPLKDAHVHMLFVKEVLPSYEGVISTLSDFPDDFQAQIDAKANGIFNEIKSTLEPMCKKVTTEVVSGSAAMMIEAVARDEGFGFTVLTPGVHTRVERFLLGSTCGKVLSHGPGTIMILRSSGQSDFQFNNVVIAVDGSAEALNAAREAVHMFDLARRKAKVSLVNVVSMAGLLKYVSPVQFVAALEANLLMSGEVVLAEAEKTLKELGVDNIELQLKEGDPATEIIKVAESSNAQLIVTGGQGRTGVEHFLIGSVSSWIASHAKCSTVVIKALRNK